MNDNDEMLVIAITGGIGAGKSAAASIIAGAGWKVIDTDRRAKEIMTESHDVRRKLINAFGSEVYLDDGSLNREFLADKVFAGTKEARKNLDKLNSIVHPAVIDDMIDRLEELREDGEEMVFVESALVFESGIEEGFDYVVSVDAPEDVRIDRIIERSGISRSDAEQRMSGQISSEEKARRADFVIENAGTIDELRRTVESLLNILISLPAKDFSKLENLDQDN